MYFKLADDCNNSLIHICYRFGILAQNIKFSRDSSFCFNLPNLSFISQGCKNRHAEFFFALFSARRISPSAQKCAKNDFSCI